MIFVTTGQRIAVENFSKGVIYKVTFTDESISYMMCVGIGKDFVMLQSAAPSLFALTMQSASRVDTIDVHDPTPPEPPTPIENALQYQTGAPPFTFTTTESSLFSWYIEGAAGVKTANLYDASNPNIFIGYYGTASNRLVSSVTNAFIYIPLVQGRKYYIYGYKRYNTSMQVRWVTTSVEPANNVECVRAGTSEQTDIITFTAGNNENYFALFLCGDGDYSTYGTVDDAIAENGANLTVDNGYKISIFTNEHTTTLYLDEPIAEGEKLYSVNTDAQIVTDIGENTLSISDPQPPEMQIVYGIYAEG